MLGSSRLIKPRPVESKGAEMPLTSWITTASGRGVSGWSVRTRDVNALSGVKRQAQDGHGMRA